MAMNAVVVVVGSGGVPLSPLSSFLALLALLALTAASAIFAAAAATGHAGAGCRGGSAGGGEWYAAAAAAAIDGCGFGTPAFPASLRCVAEGQDRRQQALWAGCCQSRPTSTNKLSLQLVKRLPRFTPGEGGVISGVH